MKYHYIVTSLNFITLFQSSIDLSPWPEFTLLYVDASIAEFYHMIILICGFYFSLSDQCLQKYIWLILYLEINILHLNKLLFRLQENVSNLERCYLFWHALEGHWVFCDGQIYICGFFGIKFCWQDTFISYTHILSQYWGSISTCFFDFASLFLLLYCCLWLASKLI